MKTLITGGAGFIGAEIARLLVARGDADVTVSHRAGSDLTRIRDLIDAGKLRTVVMDLDSPEDCERVILAEKAERIFHFAAMLSGPGEANPQANLHCNVIGFIKTIEAARLSGCKQFIFASSIGTYARDCNDAAIDDMSQQRPNLVYGVSKVFGENLGAYYRVKYGMDFRCIRYPSIVGPGVTTRSLAQYTAWMVEYPLQGKPFEIWVREGQVIPLLYYKDAARAALDILDAPIEKIKGMSYLVDMKNGFDKTPTAGEMAALVRKKIPGAQITFDENAPPVRVLRINDWRAKEEWDWKAEYDFEGMVDDMIAHYRAANN